MITKQQQQQQQCVVANNISMAMLLFVLVIMLSTTFTLAAKPALNSDHPDYRPNDDFVKHLLSTGSYMVKHHAIELGDWNGEKGIFAKEKIKQGEDIFSLPWVNIFSLDRVKHEVPTLFALFESEKLSAEDAMAVSLLYYRYCMDDITDEYLKWLQSLPNQNQLNTALYWNDDEAEYLKGSPAYVYLMVLKQETQELYVKLTDSIFQDKIFEKCTVNWDRFKWAHSIISSRGIYTEIPTSNQENQKTTTNSDSEDENQVEQQSISIVLVPFMDYFNHENDAQAVYEFDHQSNSLRVSTVKSIEQGQQIFLNYGHQDCNSNLLIDYGFIENKPNCVDVLFEELLELIPDNDNKLIEKTTILEQSFESNQRLKLFKDSMTEELLKLSKYLSYRSQSLLVYLKSLVDLKIGNYPSTLEEDLKFKSQDEDGKYKLLSKRSKMAVDMVIYEKTILKEIGSLLAMKIDESNQDNDNQQQQQQPTSPQQPSSNKVKDEL